MFQMSLPLHLGICFFATENEAKAPSVADISEHRAQVQEADVSPTEAEGYFEGTPPAGYGSFVSHPDGRLMYFSGDGVWYSADGGRSWPEGRKLSFAGEIGGVDSAIRLRNGALGIYGSGHWCTSFDEGETWTEPSCVHTTGSPYYDTMIQTDSGRLILPVRATAAGHNGLYERDSAYGTINGELTQVEGHAQFPEMDYAWCHYSDDDGVNWSRSEGEIMVWKDSGYGGMWPVDEPNIVALKDDRIMMFARTTLGRIYKVLSDDGGRRWSHPVPTDLAASYSPCRLRRIPATGDLICVWNHISADEIRSGHRRGRLSAAISCDDGESWQHFKTIDAQGLPFVDWHLAPEPVPGMVRARNFLGELPEDYGNVDYPNVGFHEEEILISYNWNRLVPKRVGRMKLRIYPVQWFYK
ncbi:MAG: sialidase family protein [Candidatus Poribacteria bacterium]|nr:sialidase family protein [Candidatus Poribacteria bacterium]